MHTAAPPGSARRCSALPGALEPAGDVRAPLACSRPAGNQQPAAAEAGPGALERGARAGGGCGARADLPAARRGRPRPGRCRRPRSAQAPVSSAGPPKPPLCTPTTPTPGDSSPAALVLPRCALPPGAGNNNVIVLHGLGASSRL